MDKLIVTWFSQVICTAIRGTLAAFPQVQVEKMLMLMAAVMGQQLAQTYAGDELSVFKMRKACKDMFCEALKNEKVTGMPRKPDDIVASIGQ
jgi:hypothetical protein